MRESERVDRLTELPNEILSHILSFVENKSGIQTILLSKRLTNSWNTVSSLNFISRFFKPDICFHGLVLTTLDRRRNDPTVHTVRFLCDSFFDARIIKRLLQYVSSNHINHLVLGCPDSYIRELLPFPIELLRCQNLKFLTLEYCKFVIPIYFPNLNSLNLERCHFSHDGNDCFDLLAYFPNLNNLRMFHCSSEGFKMFKVSGPNLLNLEIGYGWVTTECKVEISVPNLTFLSYKSWLFVERAVISLPSLKSAELHVVGYLNLEKYIIRLLKLLQGLHRARFVRLSYATIKKLKKAFAREKVSLFPQLGKGVEEARDSFEDQMYELDAHGVKSLTEKLLEMTESLKKTEISQL